MINFKDIAPAQEVNAKFILDNVRDSEIFFLYFGPFKMGDIYLSKFRKDNRPSCGFYFSTSGKLIYNDFGNGDKLDCFAFVQKLYNLTFTETVNKIAEDFGLIKGKKNPISDKVRNELLKLGVQLKKDTIISWRKEKWNDINLAYWQEYHITKEELEREKVYPIKFLRVNGILIPNINNEPRYALTVKSKKKGERLTKIYSPLSTDPRGKWINNIPLDHPFGLESFKITDKIIVTKSVKDLIILKKFLPSVIGTQNESRFSLSQRILKNINFYFDEKYVAFDNDLTGLKGMTELRDIGFTPVYVPLDFNKQGIKDWADLAKEHGLSMVKYNLQMYKIL